RGDLRVAQAAEEFERDDLLSAGRQLPYEIVQAAKQLLLLEGFVRRQSARLQARYLVQRKPLAQLLVPAMVIDHQVVGYAEQPRGKGAFVLLPQLLARHGPDYSQERFCYQVFAVLLVSHSIVDI